MTERFEKALERATTVYLEPIVELIEAATQAVQEAEQRAESAEAVLETMRPVWAQGWTTDGRAASASSNALAELWQALGAKNQTAAMDRLRRLINMEKTT